MRHETKAFLWFMNTGGIAALFLLMLIKYSGKGIMGCIIMTLPLFLFSWLMWKQLNKMDRTMHDYK